MYRPWRWSRGSGATTPGCRLGVSYILYNIDIVHTAAAATTTTTTTDDNNTITTTTTTATTTTTTTTNEITLQSTAGGPGRGLRAHAGGRPAKRAGAAAEVAVRGSGAL